MVLVPAAAVTQYHKLSGLNYRNVVSYGSRDWKPEIRKPVGCSVQTTVRDALFVPSSQLLVLLAVFGPLGSRGSVTPICFHFHPASSIFFRICPLS